MTTDAARDDRAARPAACPDCHGSGMGVEWGECLLCAGHGIVAPSLRALRLRVIRGEPTTRAERESGADLYWR